MHLSRHSLSAPAGGGGGSATPAATAPAAPAGVTVTAGNTQITPGWTADTGATSYNVYYRSSAGVTTANATKVANATAGTAITGLANGTTYYLAVTAVNANGESALSSEASAMPVAPLPAAPTGITITSSDAQAALSWTTVAGATSYNVYYGTTAGVTITNGTKITNTSSGTAITGLTNGVAYYFVVTAVNTGGESVVSSEVGTTPLAPVPGVPSGITIAAGDTQVTPSWTAVSGATSYNIYYRSSAGVTIANGTKVANAAAGTAITGLVNGTTYYLAVTAVNATGESALSSEVSAMPITPLPAAPTGITIASVNAQATLSWAAVTGATSYNVYYGTTAGVTIANGTKITNTSSGTPITGLTNGTAYYFVVTAVNAGGESVVSSEVSATPVAPPSAPKGVSIASGNAQATLTWQTVTGATSYNVYYKTAAGVTIANGTKITNTSSGTPITGLTNGTAYYFVVVAAGAGGEGAVSSEVGTTPQAPATGVASGITVYSGVGQVTLSWSAVTGATSYNVYYGTAAGVTTVNGTKVTGATSGSAIINLTNGIQHFFMVTAMSNANTIENPASAEISATPWGIPNLMGGAIQTPLTLTGTVTTVNTVNAAGITVSLNGGSSFGITTDGTNLYVGTWLNQCGGAYKKVEIATGATTTIQSPSGNIWAAGLTTDGNYLYGSDAYYFQSVNKTDIASSVNILLAGGSGGLSGSVDGTGGAARFRNPNGITMDGVNLYVADTQNHTIRKIVKSTGVVTTLAGTAGLTGNTDATGPAARFNNPTGITTDGTNLYVADSGAHIIRKVVISSGVVTTIAGSYGVAGNTNGTGSAALFNSPWSITTDGNSLYVTDYNNGVIRKIQ